MSATTSTTTTTTDEELDEVFAALANATRREILARLADGEATVSELAEPFDLTLPAISKHIGVLERAGLVVQSRRGRFRPCTIEPAPLAAATGWMERYRPIWESRFSQMDDHLARLQPPRPSPTEGPT